MVRHPIAALVGAAAAIAALAAPAAADAYLRVISQKAPVHTGPGAAYRELYTAERGEVFQVLERGGDGFWFRVELEDGTTGWILGELVFPFEVVDDENPGVFVRMGRAIRRAMLGPSPVPYSDVEISFSAGVLDNEGTFLLRPAWLLDQYFALEGFMGLSPRQDEDLFLGGLGWTLRLYPGSALSPFLNASFGAGYLRPKTDNFTQEPDTLFALGAGGGFEITFKKQITVRLDYRNWTLFDPDKASNGQEFSGGLAIFF
jgi:opacity protein-like surface antigen